MDGHLVTVKNPQLLRKGATRETIGVLEMERYQSYNVLTGPLAGRRFDRTTRPLPTVPSYRPGVLLGDAAAVSMASGSGTEKAPASGGEFRVFLCHASEDKEAVRALYCRLLSSGFRP